LTSSLACVLAYSWAISMVLCVLQIRTQPHSSVGAVTLDHPNSRTSSWRDFSSSARIFSGASGVSAVLITRLSWFSQILHVLATYSFMCWYFPWRSVSTLTFGPLRIEFSQSISSLKSWHHGYPKIKQSFPRSMT
jgi:hypothetical protein